ncbi:hypothetical protein C0Q70_20726 [Pomacea canaliculata]|uniref:Reverse transcriptase/retrotransposon-derived protein RNase H-like domain-containing protein n=1 Tax=Pomacea canaliculata TaxID=400727 RepID=A0A2T7NGD7_POMCA|nr:hypothetical protein C0Q70_20726 [Pomacea canaliculata]
MLATFTTIRRQRVSKTTTATARCCDSQTPTCLARSVTASTVSSMWRKRFDRKHPLLARQLTQDLETSRKRKREDDDQPSVSKLFKVEHKSTISKADVNSAVLDYLLECNLRLQIKSSLPNSADLDFLGHHIGRGTLAPANAKVEQLLAARLPETKKEVRSFLGLANYYRRYVNNFSAIAAPLSDLLRGKSPDKVGWSDSCQMAFETLKLRLASNNVTKMPDMAKQFFSPDRR